VSYDLSKERWIPTREGLLTLSEALDPAADHAALMCGSVLADVALLRLLTLLKARAGDDVAGYLEQHRAGFQVHGERPFMQVPPELTEALPPSPVHALDLRQATGRDSMLLSHVQDAAPVPREVTRVVLDLLVFQMFAPSRGITRFNPSKDAPLARSVSFHAHGETLAETLDLNRPEGPLSAPSWEQAPDWTLWTKGKLKDGTDKAVPVDVTRSLAWPWRSVTLEPGAADVNGEQRVSWFRWASGPAPLVDTGQVGSDQHVMQEFIPEENRKKRGDKVYDVLRNPATREVYAALVYALRRTLELDPLAPLSFRRALTQGAVRMEVTALSTRTGQPVVNTLCSASLPCPVVDDALEILTQAADGLVVLRLALMAGLRKSGDASFRAVDEGSAAHVYWEALWPALGAALEGTPLDSPAAAVVAEAVDPDAEPVLVEAGPLSEMMLPPDVGVPAEMLALGAFAAEVWTAQMQAAVSVLGPGHPGAALTRWYLTHPAEAKSAAPAAQPDDADAEEGAA